MTTNASVKATGNEMPMRDVIEVQIKSPHAVRIIARDKSESNAEAIVKMAVMRRGVKDSFFTTVSSGKFSDGDCYPQKQED